MSSAGQSLTSIGNSAVGFDTSSTVTALRALIHDPTSNPQLSIVVLAVAVLVILLLVVALLMLITPSRKRVVKVRRYAGERPAEQIDEGEPAEADASESAGGGFVAAVTSPVAIVVLILLGVIGTYVATSTDYYCADTCHRGSPASLSASKIDHAACVSCHEDRGVLGVFANASSRTRMVVAYSIGADPGQADVAFDSRSCLSCHAAVNRTISVSPRGVRMSHAEVTAAGRPCTECHAAAGHTAVAMTASMSACMVCHDTRTASAECTTCHTKEYVSGSLSPTSTLESMSSSDMVFPAVRAANRRCGACHDQKRSCDPCHGIRMPHSRDFLEGGHARAAAFEKKLACWKCHDPQFCSNGGCHNSAFRPADGSTAHGTAWKQQHKASAWDAGCVCHGAGSKRTAPMCTLCHDAHTHAVLPPMP